MAGDALVGGVAIVAQLEVGAPAFPGFDQRVREIAVLIEVLAGVDFGR